MTAKLAKKRTMAEIELEQAKVVIRLREQDISSLEYSLKERNKEIKELSGHKEVNASMAGEIYFLRQLLADISLPAVALKRLDSGICVPPSYGGFGSLR